MEATQISISRSMILISRRVMLDLIRRKDFYVLLILMLLFIMGVVVFRFVGVENASTGTFLLNLGLSLAWLAAHVLTLLAAARLMPEEYENRTIYPLLARPLKRGAMIAGEWAACTLAGFGCFLALSLLVWFGVPKMEGYDTALLGQMIVLQVLSIGLLAAIAILFSLFMPKPVNIILLGAILFVGGKLIDLIQNRFLGSGMEGVVKWFTLYVPDFSRLNLITRYTDGIAALNAGEFLALILYGVLFTATALSIAAIVFRRQAL